jgi:pimeloyl-ACP methyl ester carboxylesterase
MRHYQAARPTVYDYDADLRKLDAPTLIIVGDEDEPCLNVGVYLKRTLPRADLIVVPGTGHSVNLEEPVAFNQAIATFVDQVQRGYRPKS